MAFGFTATAGTITGTHSGFVGLFVTANFPSGSLSGPNAILNGGGNLRAYTDSTKATALPLEIVSLVTGGAPDASVRVRLNSLSTGGTVYFEADSVATTQPAVTDPIGRNAVYSNEQLAHHLIDNSTTQTDSSGNDDGTLSGTALTNTSPQIAPSNINFNGAAYVGGLSDPVSGNSYLAVRTWFKIPDTASKAVSGAWVGGDSSTSYLLFTGSNDLANIRVRANAIATATSTTVVQDDAWHHIAALYDGSQLKIIIDGVTESTVSLTGAIKTPTAPFEIGRYNNSNICDNMQEHLVSVNSNVTEDYIKTEFANQSSPSTFWTSSEWTTGSSISVTEQLKNINYTPLDPTITLTGGIVVTEQLKGISFSSLNPSITLTGVISVTEQLKNIQYQALNPVIDLTGAIDVTEQTVSINYSALSPTITLTPVPIQVTESLVSVQWKSNNPSILLTPEPIGVVSTVCFNGVLVSLEFDGSVKDVEFNGALEELEYNGNLADLEFNGTIQINCTDGSIKTDC